MNVLVLSGHTGGHLFPAVSFSESLKEKNSKISITLITSEKARPFIENKFHQLFTSVHYIKPFPSPSGLSLQWFRFLGRLVTAFFEMNKIVCDLKPKACVGFGSYVSFPGIVIAHLKKIPTLIHEQNSTPGRATQWLVPFADKIATSFPDTFKNLKFSKVICVGLPLKKHILNGCVIKNASETSENPFRLLVMGGSQGSKRLNELVIQSFFELSSEEKKKLVVIHVAGSSDYERVCEQYQKLNIEVRIFPFFDRMEELFAVSDFAISRSGANSVFELAYYGIPALLVPYPFAGEHQLPNARYFENQGSAWCVRERDLTKELLVSKIRLFMTDPNLRHNMRNNMNNLATPDAGNKLADLLLSLVGYRHDS